VPNVVWCTGYRSTFDWIHLDVFDQEGQPVHDRGATGVPGLYFIGLFFLSSLASSLVGGVGRDAEYIARHITRLTSLHNTRAVIWTQPGGCDIGQRNLAPEGPPIQRLQSRD
jgi:hypothetical protein